MSDPLGLHPFFSVVITTRDRPGLFAAALDSVLAQVGASMEVIVVDDGSAAGARDEYDRIEAAQGAGVRFIHLPVTVTGHGPCFALNAGACRGRGRYLCFLDDDDVWTDPGHLARAMRALSREGERVDLLLSDQAAFRGGERLAGPIWQEDLGARLRAAGPGDGEGMYAVDVEQLLTATGFCHVNTLIVRTEHWRSVGGFDEGLIYEGDRDFYLRAIDRSACTRYFPHVVARHHVPVPKAGRNISTRVSAFTRHLCQVELLDRAAREAATPALQRYARSQKRYALQKACGAVRSVGDVARLGACLFARPKAVRSTTAPPLDRDTVR